MMDVIFCFIVVVGELDEFGFGSEFVSFGLFGAGLGYMYLRSLLAKDFI